MCFLFRDCSRGFLNNLKRFQMITDIMKWALPKVKFTYKMIAIVFWFPTFICSGSTIDDNLTKTTALFYEIHISCPYALYCVSLEMRLITPT